jgi:sugar phosphate isomerase/epimerase
MGEGGAVKLGFLTACLPDEDLKTIVAWAGANRFDALEVAVWPSRVQRPFEATHIDVEVLGAAQADDIRRLFSDHGVQISALAYYDNNLHPDLAVRRDIHAHLRRCVDAAALLDCPYVGTFVGRDPSRTIAENVTLAEQVIRPLVDYAGERGIRLIVENCPMEGWHPDGYPGNLAYSPELWEWMFTLGLYLNYDPSHLTWLGIDPVAAIRAAGDMIVHAQAKDVETDTDGRNRFGFFGRALSRDNPWDNGSYRYRAPGLGVIDWRRVVDALYQAGFNGVLSVEHEDPVWSGSTDQVLKGLKIAHAALRPLVLLCTGTAP